MATFVFLFKNGTKPGSPKELEAQLQKWGAWFAQLKARGQPCGGDALEPYGTIVSAKGRVAIDGPSAEIKDLIVGYTMIEAANLDEAARFTEGCPALDVGGAVEVRPVMDTSSYM